MMNSLTLALLASSIVVSAMVKQCDKRKWRGAVRGGYWHEEKTVDCDPGEFCRRQWSRGYRSRQQNLDCGYCNKIFEKPVCYDLKDDKQCCCNATLCNRAPPTTTQPPATTTPIDLSYLHRCRHTFQSYTGNTYRAGDRGENTTCEEGVDYCGTDSHMKWFGCGWPESGCPANEAKETCYEWGKDCCCKTSLCNLKPKKGEVRKAPAKKTATGDMEQTIKKEGDKEKTKKKTGDKEKTKKKTGDKEKTKKKEGDKKKTKKKEEDKKETKKKKGDKEKTKKKEGDKEKKERDKEKPKKKEEESSAAAGFRAMIAHSLLLAAMVILRVFGLATM